jgi:large repetitive protein
MNSTLINENPVITASDFEITAGNQINLLDYAKCYDFEDGDLTEKIVIESSEFQQKAGIYLVTYYVEDKYKYFDRKTINIIVKEAYNDPPVILAEDRSVLQHSIFDYFTGVSAYDNQDGNLTSHVITLNDIDTSNLLDQNLCYKVVDSIGAASIKCISIHIFSEFSITSKYRYVSKTKLFYDENVPIMWLSKINDIQAILDNTVVVKSSSITVID